MKILSREQKQKLDGMDEMIWPWAGLARIVVKDATFLASVRLRQMSTFGASSSTLAVSRA